MSPTTTVLRASAAATLVAGLALIAPVLGGAAALAEEPDAPGAIVDAATATASPIEPAVEPSADAEAEVEAAPAEEAATSEGDVATEPVPEGGAPEAEAADALEPAPASSPSEAPEVEQAVAVAPAVEAVAAPAAFALEKFPAAAPAEELVSPFIGADGCAYSFVIQEGSLSISDITGCTDVVVPEEIGGFPVERVGAFSTEVTMTGARRFTSLVLPDSLFAVGPGAFKNADALVTVDFGDGVQRIEGRAFGDADALTAITLPDSVTFVGARAFEGAGAVASLDLGSVQDVRGLAFSGLGRVTELVVPATITRADDTAFGNMPRLRSILVLGDPSAFARFTFFGSAALEEVELRERSAAASIAGNIFVGATGTPTVFFRDGAFGRDCTAESITLGGATMSPKCLFDVEFDLTEGLRAELRQFNIREGSVVTDVPAVEAPAGKVFAGFSPDVAEPVVADTLYVPVFVDAVPGDYTPSEEDLVDEAQCCFVAPATVEAGQELTLTIVDDEPDPGETIEPLPGGTLEPAPAGTLEPLPAGTPAVDLPSDPEPSPEPGEDFDPNDFIDVFLFSEPLELVITGFSDNSVTVLVPETVEPGAHKIAVYSVFGELFGWQPVTVTAPPVPGGEVPGGEVPGGEVPGGEVPGGEVPGDDTPVAEDPAGDDDEAAGPDDAVVEIADDEAAEPGAEVQGAVLASTGASHVQSAVMWALTLMAVGAVLAGLRVRNVGRRTQP
ncbi:leucine-rich repeat domain-containing protein [Demequina iriomotensis]|uniref:leucine-rich repeat domain-containing protein n=1 Tax=Demequina iriomotensis TaxID=1536641 RepID=UPI000B07AF67|nr:leucine-rich repeat domain-containing protein [Demequina iriomotensis]